MKLATRNTRLNVEVLESREMPAVTFRSLYSTFSRYSYQPPPAPMQYVAQMASQIGSSTDMGGEKPPEPSIIGVLVAL
jgi:hypothetical protein